MATAPEDIDNEPIDAGNDDPPPEPVELTEVEKVAQDIGWKPKHAYKGDKAKWRPADEYIRQSKNIEGTLKDSIKDLRGTVDRMANAHAKQTERALQEQAARHKAQLDQAVEDGDREGAREAHKAIAATEREIERVAKAASPEDQFAKDNPWYGKDDDATAYATAISQREFAKGKSVEDQLKAAAEGVRKRFPELFEDGEKRPTLKAPPAVNAPSSRSTGQRRGTGYADLPADVKAAADKYADLFARKFSVDPVKAKADYARDYFANTQAA